MPRIRKLAPFVIPTLFLLGWGGFGVRADYSWAGRIEANLASKGWRPASRQSDLIVPSHPWTIVRQPVARIAFVRPDDYMWLDSRNALIQVLWMDYAGLERTEEFLAHTVIDCARRRSAFIEREKLSVRPNLATLEWRDDTSQSAREISSAVCNTNPLVTGSN
jgi:hypothetical protein